MTLTMTDKMRAIQVLDPSACLRVSIQDQWYVAARVEIAGDGVLTSSGGHGATPEAAVENWWREHCEELPRPFYLRCGERNVRWRYGWEDMREDATH